MKEQVVKRMNEFKDAEVEFYTSEYLNHTEALLDFFESNGFELNEREIEEMGDCVYIDADDIACHRKEMEIHSLNLHITTVACHHKKWDFYFDSVKELLEGETKEERSTKPLSTFRVQILLTGFIIANSDNEQNAKKDVQQHLSERIKKLENLTQYHFIKGNFVTDVLQREDYLNGTSSYDVHFELRMETLVDEEDQGEASEQINFKISLLDNKIQEIIGTSVFDEDGYIENITELR